MCADPDCLCLGQHFPEPCAVVGHIWCAECMKPWPCLGADKPHPA